MLISHCDADVSLRYLKRIKKILFMLVANQQLGAAFWRRSTSVLQGSLEPSEVAITKNTHTHSLVTHHRN